LDYVNGHSVAAYVYRYRGHTVNLFTWPAGQTDEAPESQSLGGFHVLHWIRAGTNWWEVSDTGVELRVFD
jgi:anti-sigma factor RsiW